MEDNYFVFFEGFKGYVVKVKVSLFLGIFEIKIGDVLGFCRVFIYELVIVL